jgi:alkanesulfonate monooxygenase SsuD/methylene tetrahydromethanopterin reductase-like flavin-dependent oxidoreductase (luciferase family)
MGTESGETALRRVARLSDGWMSLGDPVPDIPRLQQYMREAGRDPSQLKVRGPLVVGDDTRGMIERARAMAEGGVTHINLVAPPDREPRAALPTIVAARRVLRDALVA